MRTPARRSKPRIAQSKAYPGPSGGRVSNQSLADPNKRRGMPQGAAFLENWFPTAQGGRMRAGSLKYATVGDGSDDVTSMFSYSNGNNVKLFGATETDIYDLTTVADPDVSPTADVGTLTGGNWVSAQFATAGGTFLRLVNGMDTPLVYDGSTFGATPTITFADATTADELSYVWPFKNRLFFVKKESLDAYYLPVDTIGGAAVAFPMGGVFSLGGSLLFGAQWSTDTGSGLSEQCVFVTTEGEVAVYQGTDPGDATAWSKVGVYRIGKPLGSKAHIRAGGDLIIATGLGFVPISQAVQRDVAVLAPAAVSAPIAPDWAEEAGDRSFAAWHAIVWPTKQMVAVALPTSDDEAPLMFMANAETGAWTNYTGWAGTCLAVFGDRAFFGSSEGRVIEMEVTGSDDGAPYTATYVPLFEDLKSPMSLKATLMARAAYLAPAEVEERLSIQSDFVVALPPVPDAVVAEGSGLWGSAEWGASVWGASRANTMHQNWRSVSGEGYAISPAIQITSGDTAPPAVELVRIDLTYDVADIVT